MAGKMKYSYKHAEPLEGEAQDKPGDYEGLPDTDDVRGCGAYAVQPDPVKGAAGNLLSEAEAKAL